MIKPIAVIYVPYNVVDSAGDFNAWEFAIALNGEDNTKYVVNKELYKDYLWFCFPTYDKDFKIEVFHPKDFTEVQYSELKDLITNEINKIKLQ